MDKKTVIIYQTKNGKEPFYQWLNSVKDITNKLRIRNRVLKLITGYLGDCKKLRGGICELRLHFGSGYRIYFAELDKIVILLITGGNKKTQSKDIVKAKQYLKDFLERR